MKRIAVTLEGTTPMLMHSAASMLAKDPREKTHKVIPTPEEEAAAGRYLTRDKRFLCIPSRNVYRCVVNATSRGDFKVPGSKMKPLGPTVAAGISIDPYDIVLMRNGKPLEAGEYEIDVQRAVVQRQGVARARARIDRWEASFIVTLDDATLNSGLLKTVVTYALDRVGLGDFRPEKKGPYGRSRIVDWKDLE